MRTWDLTTTCATDKERSMKMSALCSSQSFHTIILGRVNQKYLRLGFCDKEWGNARSQEMKREAKVLGMNILLDQVPRARA